MNNQILLISLLSLSFLVSGCVANFPDTTAATSPAVPTESPATEAPTVEDKAGLIAALQASGGTLETGDPISQPSFTPEGSIIKVNVELLEGVLGPQFAGR